MIRLSYSTLLAICLAPLACGDDGGGAATDAGDQVDADDTDAEPVSTTCGIVASDQSGWGPGTQALFSHPDGAVIGVELLDVDGEASREDCVADSMITLISFDRFGDRGTAPVALWTIAAVQPGDTVLVDEPEDGSPEPPPTYADLNVTTSTDVDAFVNASSRDVLFGCGGAFNSPGFTPATLQFSNVGAACGADGDIDVLAYLRDSEGNRIASAFVRGATLNLGTADAQALTEVTLGPWQPFSATSSVTVTNVPPATDRLARSIAQVIDDLTWSSSTRSAPFPDPDVVGTVAYPEGFGDFTVASARIGSSIGNYRAFQAVGSVTSFQNQVSFDVGANVLPRIVGLAVTQSSGRLTFSWFADGSLAEGDLLSATVEWDDESLDAYGYWRIFIPAGDTTSFVTPILPDVVSTMGPPAGAELEPYEMGVIETSVLDYQQFLTGFGLVQVPGLLKRTSLSIGNLPFAGEGTARWNYWYDNNLR